tara:strand:- start:1466 stop:2221 length:756 start_codon:yes stop_codon:yes gene_type:complete
MIKKRLIFTLLFCDGIFMLSRNFRLQKVGDFNWINKFYNFSKIAYSIDELIILDVSRNNRDKFFFSNTIKEIIKNVFIPISVGGGIRDVKGVELFLNSGADKVVVNSLLYQNPQIIKDLVKTYGSQCIVASVDYSENNVFIKNGEEKLDFKLNDYLKFVQGLGVGEIYLNSIIKDGTGQGFDLSSVNKILDSINIPIIIAGGAGNSLHLIEGLETNKIDAVATANLFNFLGDSLPIARKEILDKKLPLAKF